MKKIFILFIVLLLSNCFNYKEELWINEDLSGKIRMSFQLGELFSSFIMDSSSSSQFFSQGKSFKDLKSIKGVTLLDTQIIREEKSVTIVSEFKFNNIQDINKIKKFISQSEFFPTVKLLKNPNGLWTYKREFEQEKKQDTVSTTDDATEQMASSMANAMFGSMFGDMSTEYIVHIKKPVLRSNADSSRTGKSHTTFIWHYAITESFSNTNTISIDFSNKALKSKKAKNGTLYYLWPKGIVSDSLSRIIGKNKLTWGRIDSIATIRYTLGINDISGGGSLQNCIHSLQISYGKNKKISFGEIVSPHTTYTINTKDHIPLILTKDKVTKVITNYNNFFGWQIVKQASGKKVYGLKQL